MFSVQTCLIRCVNAAELSTDVSYEMISTEEYSNDHNFLLLSLFNHETASSSQSGHPALLLTKDLSPKPAMAMFDAASMFVMLARILGEADNQCRLSFGQYSDYWQLKCRWRIR